MFKQSVLLGACLTATILFGGCGSGDDLASVKGVVKLDGQPASGLNVEFEPKTPGTGTTALGHTQANGSYELYYPGDKKGAPPGEYTVRISGAETEDPAQQKVVAPKFNTESELSATVAPGENTFNFEVTSQ